LEGDENKMADKITLAQMNSGLYKEAHELGMTLSMFLESNNPAPEGSKLDAFERLMR
jgi:hypothetical protein